MPSQQQAEKLPAELRLIVALSALAAISHPTNPLSKSQIPYFKDQTSAWFESLLKLLDFGRERLPQSVRPEDVKESAEEAASGWSEDVRKLISTTLVQSALAATTGKPAGKEGSTADKAKEMLKIKISNDEKAQSLAYTPLSRAMAHRTLHLLSLPPHYLAEAEHKLAISLFEALKTMSDPEKQKEEVEEARKAHASGWGGQLGRALAIGAGTIGAGVIIGVTGGLAAPGIVALLAPLGISGGLLSASVAPVALGTLFGVGGGGLAGRRVGERWRGVADFGFVEVGHGTKQTQEEIDDMKEVKARAKVNKEKAEQDAADGKDQEQGDGELAVEERLLELSISSPRASVDAGRRESIDSQSSVEKHVAQVKKPPSLTATIVVPGLLTVSATEAITAWRALCNLNDPAAAGSPSAQGGKPLALADGRDVYVLRFESAGMLKTGRDVDFWVTNKLKKKVISEVIKRTVFNAYMAAVALPMSVYSMATMSLDNTWMQAQDKARKAGRILGEVIEKKVQGERPVVLIGSSLGALTIHHALQYLASLPPPTGVEGAPVPQYVESAYLISLPSAPTQDEWRRSRQVVARRLLNAWSSNDYVLAGVVRLHEVVSKAAVMSSGLKVAGLGPVEMPGVEDVDVSSALGGHFELQAKMGDIMEIIDVDK